jgi:hypothetical protein
VYRFDALLLRADKRDHSFDGSSPLKRLKAFSANPKNLNVSFSLINGVNLLGGSYFLANALSSGAVSVVSSVSRSGQHISHMVSQITGEAPSYLYGMTYTLSSIILDNPLPFITIGLGFVPLIFSLLFWLIPIARAGRVKQENEHIQMENLRKIGYSRIWGSPRDVKSGDISAELESCLPKRLAPAQERIIKEIGAYAVPEVSVAADGKTAYTFTELEREKTALEKYRNGVKIAGLGATVFDSAE